MAKKVYDKPKMVPVPSRSIIPERAANKSPILECSHLGIDFGGLTAVDSFNITIGPTEISGLIGPNGAGKTTIFNLLTGVYQPTRGSVLINGIDIKGMPIHKVNKLGIARTFQNIRLFNNMTVIRNVLVGLHNQPEFKCSMIESMLRLPRHFSCEKRMRERAKEILRIVGLEEERNMLSCNLPYGKQRKLEIARALATNPKILLLDEPVTGLDPHVTTELYGQIYHLNKMDGITVIMISHDVAAALQYASHILHIGKRMFFGTREEFLRSEVGKYFALMHGGGKL